LPTPRFSSREEYLAWKSGRPPASSDPSSTASGPVVEPSTPAGRKPRQSLKEAFSGLPGWAWLFILGCLAVPIVSLGGAVPGALGFGGAAGCANMAKKAGWEVLPRVMICAVITGGVWLLFIVFMVAVASFQK
jgi:hypothetical protein